MADIPSESERLSLLRIDIELAILEIELAILEIEGGWLNSAIIRLKNALMTDYKFIINKHDVREQKGS